MPYSSSTLAIGVVALVGALTPACSDSIQAGAPSSSANFEGHVRRLDASRATTQPEAGAETDEIVAHYVANEDGAPWRVLKGQAALHSGEGRNARPYQTIEAEDFERVVVLEERLDPTSFDRIEVSYRIRAAKPLYAMASLRRVGEIITGNDTLERARPKGVLAFDLPKNRGVQGTVDELRLDLPKGPLSGFGIESIALVRRPLLGGWLPLEGAAPEPFNVNGDLRRAVSLSTRGSLAYEFEVQEAEHLHLAIGTPAAAGRAVGRCQLEVHVAGPQEERTDRFEVESTRGWQEVRVPLEEFTGQAVRVQLRLAPLPQAEAESTTQPMAVLIETPRLEKAVERAHRVLLITSDTHRADHLGKAKASRMRTPFLDELAERGTLFEDCYASAQTTVPSHAALMTGLSPLENGVLSNGYSLASEASTLAELFAEAGYRTYAALSVNHLDPKISGLGQGFDRLAPTEFVQRDSEQTREILNHWLDETPDVPLFVWLHVFDAHTPYKAPESYEDWSGKDPRRRDLPRLKREHSARWDGSLRDTDYIESLYQAEVRYVDQSLRAALDHPLLAGALVAFTSDHGEVLRSRDDRKWWSHTEVINDTLQIPLILQGPGVPAGERTTRSVQQIDVGRTLLDLSALDHVIFPGANLFEERPAEPRFAFGHHGRTCSVQLGRWLLNMRVLPSPDEEKLGDFEHSLELFDLEVDRACLRDLSEAEPRATRRLRAMLIDWLMNGARERLVGESQLDDEELRSQLESLGYATDAGEPVGEFWDPDCKCTPCTEYAVDSGDLR